MATSGRFRSWALHALLALFIASCAGEGCSGCQMQELPGGALPADQTVEGGAQIRVSPAGFEKLTAIVPALINDTLDEGFCIPEDEVVDVGVAAASICDTNAGGCTDGCPVSVNLDEFDAVPDTKNNEIDLFIQLDASVPVHISYEVFWVVTGSCTATFTLDDGSADISVELGTDPATGELEVGLSNIENLDLTGIGVTGNCGGLESIVNAGLNLFAGLLNTFLGDIFLDLLRPLLEDLLQEMLPDPLGVEGRANLDGLFAAISPSTRADLEMRLVPGGFVGVRSGGLDLGVITGLNADREPSTRDADFDSEPALCVPRFDPPALGEAPHELGKTTRDTFELPASNEVLQTGGKDISIGLSEMTLDLAGHHLTTSGAVCLELGTEVVPQLNLGALGLIVPSLAELGTTEGDDPLLLVTRPTQPLDFTVGEGTEASPSLTLHIDDFEIDFYAFLFDRYVRGFTVGLDLDVGINLDFKTDADGNAVILPMLVGLEAENIGVTVLNEEFVRESKSDLEEVFPAVLNLVLPQVAGAIQEIALPEFAGFKLSDLSVTRRGSFLTIGASLAPGEMLAQLGQIFPSVQEVADDMAPAQPAPASEATARLVSVHTPELIAVRAALFGESGGDRASVVIETDETDAQGRPLEWTWRLGTGMWRPFRPGGTITIEDEAFALQGRYRLELAPRVAGDYRTLSDDTTSFEVVIDSVGPRIDTHRAALIGGDVVIPAVDLVTDNELIEFAFGHADARRPRTEWATGGITRAHASAIAGASGDLRVWARDDQGNESTAQIQLSTLSIQGTSAGGCSQGNGTRDAALGLLVALLALGLWRRRATRAAPLLALALVASACGGGGGGATTCEINEDCAEECEDNQIPLCHEMQCLCLNDVPRGRNGQYASMARDDADVMWVAGYNSTHGDLVIASTSETGRVPDEKWEYVDGVPDGPIVVEGSDIRGGINDAGDDVGLYPDITVTPDGVVAVSYFDRTGGSLKVALNSGDGWSAHVVDAGTPNGDPEFGRSVMGQFSSISADQSGKLAVAYFAETESGGEITGELRIAESSSKRPQSAGDWTVTTVDSATVAASEDPLPVPDGTGLFADLVRLSDDSLVVVYHDRTSGGLMMATQTNGVFGEPVVVDEGGNAEVGWNPSALVDDDNVIHIAYVDWTNRALLYTAANSTDTSSTPREIEVVDDGYRLVGQNADGLPKPEFHFVGEDSAIVMTNVGLVITYQDATTHELLVASRNDAENWQHTALAGNEDPFVGAYGFYSSAISDGSRITVSSWALDQNVNQTWVEIFRHRLVIE